MFGSQLKVYFADAPGQTAHAYFDPLKAGYSFIDFRKKMEEAMAALDA